METKFTLIGTHNGQPFSKEFRSSANLSYQIEKLMERGSIGDKLSVEIVADDLPDAIPLTGTALSNPFHPEVEDA